MKNLIGLIAFILLLGLTANAQLPLNFGSSGWKYYMKNSSPIKPQDYATVLGDVGFPGTYNWTSPNYNTVLGVPWLSSATLPIGYGTNWSGYTSSFIWGTNPTVSPIPRTSYYRKTLTSITGYSSITINCKSDDAVVIYLNGTEVHRTSNLPAFPTTILPTTIPSSKIDVSSPLSSFQTSVTISGSTLTSILAAHPTSGNLTVTAEVHQHDTGSGEFTSSGDSYFDIEITGTSGPLTPLITRGPYLQLPTPYGMQVRWSTNTSEIGKVCYSSSGPITISNPGICQNQTVSTTSLEHIVDITGLSYSTKYYYSIQHLTSSLIEESTDHFFNTPPNSVDNSKTTRIWVTGDCSEGAYIGNQLPVLNGFENYKILNSLPAADLWLLLGDNAYDFGTDTEYGSKFFNPYDASSSNVMKQTPILPCAGNHDYYNGPDIGTTLKATLEANNPVLGASIFATGSPYALSDYRVTKNNAFFDVFSMPTSSIPKYNVSSASGKKAYYSYNHNNIHFVCLDSYGFYNNYLLYGDIPTFPALPNSTTNQQFDWLISDLNSSKLDPNIKWTILYWHHAPYTRGGGHFSDTTTADEFILKGIREKLIKYLDNAEYKIDLVLNGHSHSYERSRLLKNHHDDELTFSSTSNNNPSIIPGTNSFANSDGKFTGYTSCPYIKSSTNTINEGVVYVVTGSAGQRQPTTHLNPTDGITLKGHKALNGASFSTPTATNRGTIEDTQGGSFYLEIQSNRLDAKFINESGVVADNFTIFKDVSSPTIVNQIHQNELPGQSPDLQKLSTPAWPGVTQFTLTNPIGSTTGPHPSGLINATTPDIGPLYTIKDQTGCLKQDYRFTFNGSCWGNLNINNTFYPTATPEVISSSGVITSKSLIKNTANVSFIAKNANNLITIGTPPLFQAELGSIFSATLNSSLSCPPGGM